MRYRMFLLLSVLAVGLLGFGVPASAYYPTDAYRLERAQISGYVESVENQVACVRTDDGDEISVQLGPESYWDAQHYYLPQGEYVTMDVWYDPTDYYTNWYFAGEIWGPDFDFVLTNDEGVPYWVIYRDDYYYARGYRASCVSYMVWFDCPPTIFVYLMLPPPPPRTYVCFYGPRWREHHRDWDYGRRFGQGGSYWQDGQGYQRPGRRNHEDVRDNGNTAINRDVEHPIPLRPATPATVKLPQRNDPPQVRPVAPMPRNNPQVAVPRRDYPNQRVAVAPPVERKVTIPVRASEKPQMQPRKVEMPKQNPPAVTVVRPEAPRGKAMPQSNPVVRAKQIEKSNSADKRDNNQKRTDR